MCNHSAPPATWWATVANFQLSLSCSDRCQAPPKTFRPAHAFWPVPTPTAGKSSHSVNMFIHAKYSVTCEP